MNVYAMEYGCLDGGLTVLVAAESVDEAYLIGKANFDCVDFDSIRLIDGVKSEYQNCVIQEL
jgi:hypothetical protein